jgi:hypothetical protein
VSRLVYACGLGLACRQCGVLLPWSRRLAADRWGGAARHNQIVIGNALPCHFLCDFSQLKLLINFNVCGKNIVSKLFIN